jgi:hypothetical protein
MFLFLSDGMWADFPWSVGSLAEVPPSLGTVARIVDPGTVNERALEILCIRAFGRLHRQSTYAYEGIPLSLAMGRSGAALLSIYVLLFQLQASHSKLA